MSGLRGITEVQDKILSCEQIYAQLEPRTDIVSTAKKLEQASTLVILDLHKDKELFNVSYLHKRTFSCLLRYEKLNEHQSLSSLPERIELAYTINALMWLQGYDTMPQSQPAALPFAAPQSTSEVVKK